MAYFNNLIVGGTAKFLQDVQVKGLTHSIEQYWEWTEADVEGEVESVLITPPKEGFNRCKLWLFEKRDETADYINPNSEFVPYQVSTGYPFLGGILQAGESLKNVHLSGDSKKQGTTWIVSAYAEISYTKKNMFMNWSVGVDQFANGDTTKTGEYENFSQGVDAFMLNTEYFSNDNIVEDYFSEGVVPAFYYEMPKKVGNYIKAVWYKD